MNLQTETVLAKIAVNKSLLKEFVSNNQRIVYLKDNSEFQIQIFNPYTYTIGADIYINGTQMPNRIVLKPGERIWLERYLNEARKLLFSTYEVENTSEVKAAIQNNGEVKLMFYKEKVYQEPVHIYTSPITTYYNNCNYCIDDCVAKGIDINSSINYSDSVRTLGLGDTVQTAATATSATSAASYTSYSSTCKSYNLDLELNSNLKLKNSSDTIETGRIEKGSHSNQEFQNIDLNFEWWSFKTEVIKLLPISQKPITKKDLKKLYCANCGHKVNTKFKFCPYCGAKI